MKKRKLSEEQKRILRKNNYSEKKIKELEKMLNRGDFLERYLCIDKINEQNQEQIIRRSVLCVFIVMIACTLFTLSYFPDWPVWIPGRRGFSLHTLVCLIVCVLIFPIIIRCFIFFGEKNKRNKY